MKNRLRKIKRTCAICSTEYKIESFWLEERDTPYNDGFCPKSIDHYMIKRRKLIAAIPGKTKQAWLDLFRTGKTVGECNKELGLSFDEGTGILDENIESVSILRTVAKGTEGLNK